MSNEIIDRIGTQVEDYGGYLSVAIFSQDPDSGVRKVAKLVFEEWNDTRPVPPTFSLSLTGSQQRIAQKLVNDLWELGIRATQANGSAGQLAAVNDHLVDMKQITNRLLNEVCRKEVVTVNGPSGPMLRV